MLSKERKLVLVPRVVVLLFVLSLSCRPAAVASEPPDASVPAATNATPPVTATKGFLRASPACTGCLSELRAEGGECLRKFRACVADPACLAQLASIDSCAGPAGNKCFENCAVNASFPVLEKAQDFLFCACCRSACVESCEDTCVRYRSTSVGPVGAGCLFPGFEQQSGACNGCVEHAHISTAGVTKEYDACLAADGCFDQATCVGRCRDATCVAACRAGPEAIAYLKKGCAVCASACAPRCALLP
jgi:hypothetical protein